MLWAVPAQPWSMIGDAQLWHAAGHATLTKFSSQLPLLQLLCVVTLSADNVSPPMAAFGWAAVFISGLCTIFVTEGGGSRLLQWWMLHHGTSAGPNVVPKGPELYDSGPFRASRPSRLPLRNQDQSSASPFRALGVAQDGQHVIRPSRVYNGHNQPRNKAASYPTAPTTWYPTCLTKPK